MLQVSVYFSQLEISTQSITHTIFYFKNPKCIITLSVAQETKQLLYSFLALTLPLLWGGFWVRSRRMLIWCTAPKGSKSSFSSVSDQERGICPTNILMVSGSGWSKCSSDPFILLPLPLLGKIEKEVLFTWSSPGINQDQICNKDYTIIQKLNNKVTLGLRLFHHLLLKLEASNIIFVKKILLTKI